MANYPTDRDVDNSIEMTGLKGKYIIIALIVVFVLFVLAIILGSTSMNIWLVIVTIGGLTYGVIRTLIIISKKYGIHGLMKLRVINSLPAYVKNIYLLKEIITKL